MMTSYIPAASDFDRHQHSYPAHYPPFPTRLLTERVRTTAAFNSATFNAAPVRRVRPVPVAPPPGLEGYVNPSRHNHSRSAGNVNTVLSSAMGSSTAHGLSVASSGARYSEFAKLRAVAGALAGDWSRGRQLPDIPAFLLASVLDVNNANSVNGVDNKRDDVNNVLSTLFSRQTLSFGTFGAGGPDLAHFCRNNNIASNVLRDGAAAPITSSSSLSSSSNALPFSAKVPSRFSSRLMAPVASHAVASESGKRRLAPTAVTADNILGSASTMWRKQNVSQVRPLEPLDPAGRSTPTNKMIPQESQGFQRTPRAPRTSLLSQQLAAGDSARSKLGSEVIAAETKEYSYFDQREQKQHSQPYAYRSERHSPITQLASDNSSPVNLSSAPTTVSTTPCAEEMVGRAKIPPAPESSLERKVEQRQKQIDIGKNTVEYYNYRRLVPRNERTRTDPMTPDKFQGISKRNWEGQMKAWRRRLHEFEPPAVDANCEAIPRKFTAPRDPRVDDVVPAAVEEGEIVFWKQEDDKWMEQYGGVDEWEKFMLEHVRNRMQREKAAAHSIPDTVVEETAEEIFIVGN